MYESAEASKNGKVFIFNNTEFNDDGLAPREGSDKDEKDLRNVFKNHGYDVAEEMKNLRMLQFLTKIEEISKTDFSDYKCMISIFLSHGEKSHIYMKDRRVELEQITECFRGDQCPSLNEKPKIFIFQACRGGKTEKPVPDKTAKTQHISGDIECDVVGFDEKSESETQKTSESETKKTSEREASVEEDAGASCYVPAGADFVMCFASSDGYVSFRHPVSGSRFIQMLVSTLKEYFDGKNEDTFLDLMTNVSCQVSQQSESGSKMQMPSIISMLRGKFRLPK